MTIATKIEPNSLIPTWQGERLHVENYMNFLFTL